MSNWSCPVCGWLCCGTLTDVVSRAYDHLVAMHPDKYDDTDE